MAIMESTLIDSSTLGQNHSALQEFETGRILGDEMSTQTNESISTEDKLVHCTSTNDSTFDLEEDDDDDQEVDEVNVSILSAPPIRNLIGTFDDMEEKLDIKKDGTDSADAATRKHLRSPSESGGKGIRDESPNGIDGFPETSVDKEERIVLSDTMAYPYACKINIPEFQLHESLRLNLAQPVINRCSFYSIIHGVNKEVQDMALQDKNQNALQEVDEDSALVQAVSGPSKQSNEGNKDPVELAVLDEEKFLLAAIANRSEIEMSIRACPESFAEAIGEVDPSRTEGSTTANGQTANPLQVLATSRTQLWKPSRSWWEAKSGKNPWIEPKLHNRRWRYLWPLIHYHKFLAKCIKKLKRNKIDVKTSLSPVSAFLREEVCAVSDHLAASSKFTSDEWMAGLPHFYGWVNHNPDVQKQLQQMVSNLPIRNLTEPTDVDSPLLRSQIDQSFLKAMAEAREQMKDGAQEQYVKRSDDTDSARDDAQSRSSRDTDASRFSHMKSPRSRSNGNRTPGNQHDGRMMGINRSYSGNWSVIDHPVPHGVYPHQFSYNPYSGHHPTQYVPYGSWGMHGDHQSHMSNEWGHPMHNMPYYNSWNGGMGSDRDLPFYPPAGDSSVGHNSGVVSVDTGGSRNASHHFNQMHMSEQSGDIKAEDGSFHEVQNGIMQTPSKNRNADGNPSSPYWGHLQYAAMAGIGTPGEGHQQRSANDVNDRGRWSNKKKGKSSGVKKAKPLLINSNYSYHQGGAVPPSPATQFLMSPQANNKTRAYFNTGHNVAGFSTPSKAGSRQRSSDISSKHEESSTETRGETSMKGIRDNDQN